MARLSPLKHKDLNVLSRYGFTASASAPAGGGLRPLRDPDAAGLDEDDEEWAASADPAAGAVSAGGDRRVLPVERSVVSVVV